MSLGQQYQPSGIVVFTAHWDVKASPTTKITHTDGKLDTIYDFSGFPDEMYQIKYPAHGSTSLSNKISDSFTKSGISCEFETKRGLDHGTWTLLHLMYPKADIPVVQISVSSKLPPQKQFAIGQALRQLRQTEKIMIIGSGASVHNLGALDMDSEHPESWASKFDDWVVDRIMNFKDNDAAKQELFGYEKLAPNAKKAHPSPDHFIPLFIAMGAGDIETQKPKVVHKSYQYGSLSYMCMQF